VSGTAASGAAPVAGFPAVWLRHNCPCPDCRDPGTGQRLVEITDIANGPCATVTAHTADTIEVTFTPDGKVLWRAQDLSAVPAADWDAYQHDDAVRERCLDAVVSFGFVLLHCLRDAAVGGDAAGGDTVLVDGFAAASALRAADPDVFGVATGTPVPFAYIDKGTELTARKPLITLSPRGRIACVRLNNRSMRAPRLPAGQPQALYAACRAWVRMAGRPEFRLRLRLTPGTAWSSTTPASCTRTAFAATGERHLQGCYADLDALLSALAVLRRR
jgi:hypothetical protein